MLLLCALNESPTSLGVTEWEKRKAEKRRGVGEQCEPIYTSRAEPERLWGHTETCTASLTRQHIKHLTFNQYMEIPGLMWRGCEKPEIMSAHTARRYQCSSGGQLLQQ